MGAVDSKVEEVAASAVYKERNDRLAPKTTPHVNPEIRSVPSSTAYTMRRRPHRSASVNALSILLALISYLPFLIQAHGYVSWPPIRSVGPAMVAACGALIAAEIERDNTSHVEGLPELAMRRDSRYGGVERCNLWLCKGLQFADNNGSSRASTSDNGSSTLANNAGISTSTGTGGTSNVQGPWIPGQTVRMTVTITIPHEGTANVSVVDAATNEIVPGGELLAYWKDGYASERGFYARTMPKNQTDFEVRIPDLKGRCAVPGECVS